MTECGLSILNVGEGDAKLSFSRDNPAERVRCARIVTDMIRRGYILLVEVERDGAKGFQRVHQFDEAACEYIIADIEPDPASARESEERTATHGQREGESAAPPAAAEGPPAPTPAPRQGDGRHGGKRTKRIGADHARAVGVARTAGG